MRVTRALDSSPTSSHWQRLWPWALLLFGGASAVWPLLGLPAAFASFIGVLSLPASTAARRGVRWAVALAAVGAGVGVVRFVAFEAMPGIVGGGRRAVEQRAVSRLRAVLFAEDAMRRAGWIDPDADGVGSAAFLSELCGGPPLRGQPARALPVLDCGELVASPLGPAARTGAYLYSVCLPTRDGAWTAQPGPVVDEEKAERHFVAYAWPEMPAAFDEVFFLDQDENIWVGTLPERAAQLGNEPAPVPMDLRCDSALGGQPALGWGVWRGKKPRQQLPGDTSAQVTDGTRRP